MRYAMQIEFDGRSLSGTAIQPGHPTLQSLFREALAAIGEQGGQLQTSSRLDAGVSAWQLGGHVDCRREWQPLTLAKALSANLPRTVSVVAAAAVTGDWHAMRNCSSKTYSYSILERQRPCALISHVVWYRHLPMAARAVALAPALNGTHRLAGFAALRGDASDQMVRPRTYRDAVWSIEPFHAGGRLHTFRITGDGFLYKQVRGCVGALMALAFGRGRETDFRAALDSEQLGSFPGGEVAPAEGLVLERSTFDPDPDWVLAV